MFVVLQRARLTFKGNAHRVANSTAEDATANAVALINGSHIPGLKLDRTFKVALNCG